MAEPGPPKRFPISYGYASFLWLIRCCVVKGASHKLNRTAAEERPPE